MLDVSNSPDDILQQILIHCIGKFVCYLRYVQCTHTTRVNGILSKMYKTDRRLLSITITKHAMLYLMYFLFVLVREITKCIDQSYETADRRELVSCSFSL